MRDLYTEVAYQMVKEPTLIAATYTSNAIPVAHEKARDCVIVILAGVVTDGTHTWEIQECDTSGGVYTAVADDDLEGDTEPAVTSSNDQDRWVIAYRGTKPYLKVVNTVTGSPSTGGLFAVVAVHGDPVERPVDH